MDRPPMERALSTDVVMDIVLSYLKVADLLNCRIASKFWNKAASSVLRRRLTMIKIISDENQLMELQDCVEQNADFPFTGLKFGVPWTFNSLGAIEFFKNHGRRFTSLHLGTWSTTRIQDLAPFLKNHPLLSILEMGEPGSHPPSAVLDTAAGHEDGRILKLPSLRTIRISSELNEDVLRQVCAAASPSLRVECLGVTYRLLRALKSAGKLQAVSVLNLFGRIPHCCALRSDELFLNETPTLSKLEFSIDSFRSLVVLKKLLVSSQHTLKELRLDGIWPSKLLSECPVLAKLTTLSLCIGNQFYDYIFEGSQGHKFPALKELKLDTMFREYDPLYVNVSDDLFIVPSLTKIELRGHVGTAGIEDLARSFPNVIEIQLQQNVYDFERSSWHRDPTQIWSVGAFKFLEKLIIWDYTVKPPIKTFEDLCDFNDCNLINKFKMMNMDSFLTGIPLSVCENLRQHAQQNLTDSAFNEILRDSPNILQLKNLKELIVCVDLDFDFEVAWDKLPEEPPFISMVSVWYALQMMPNLRAKFVYDCSSRPFCFEEGESGKAVTFLKAAFKHVQPYVELEPFFY